MHSFPEKFLRKGVKEALMAAGLVLQQALQARAPVAEDVTHGHEPGFLRDHIAITSTISTKYDKGSVKVGPVAKAFWGMFAEFGTRLQAALPWMRPAFEGDGQNALDAFVSKLREKFQEATR
jgi:HK97 gp10 family phage protein